MSVAGADTIGPFEVGIGVLVVLLINLAAAMMANAFNAQITGNLQWFVWIGSLLAGALAAKSA